MDYSEQIAISEEENKVDLREVITKYLRHWYWFLISLLVLIAAAFLYLRITPPVYQVQSALLIREDKGSSGGADLENDILSQLNLFGANANVDNEMAIIQSRSLIEQVVRNLDLCTAYFQKDGLRSVELYRKSPIRIAVIQRRDTLDPIDLTVRMQQDGTFQVSDQDSEQVIRGGKIADLPSGHFLVRKVSADSAGTEIEVKINTLPKVVQAYQSNLSVSTTSKTSSVITLDLKTTVPRKGIDFLNDLIRVYNDAGLQDKNQTAANTVRFVDGRLDSISGELNAVELQLEQFMQSHSMADLDEQSKLFLDQVKDVDNQLAVQQLRLNVLQSIERYVSSPVVDSNSSMVPSSLGIDDPTLLSLIQQYNQLQLERSRNLTAGATQNNPLIRTMDTQIARLRSDIRENVRNLQQGAQLAVDKLQSQNSYFEDQIRSVPALERNYIGIKRQQEIKQNLYLYLLQKREEAAISQASSVYGSRLVDAASSNLQPVSPKTSLIYLAALILGLGLPAGLLYAGDLLNNKVQSRKEVEGHTRAPILSEISHSLEPGQIVVQPGSRSAIAEQFRSLRTNLGFMTGTDDGNTAARTLLVTSSTSGEGKSFISLNLAASYVLAGKRTVILGLDLRNPKLSRVTQTEHRTGISNFLAGQAGLEELPVELSFGGHDHPLYVIPSGPVPPNPSELLLKPKMKELIAYLKERFDVVILDTPPVGMVTDAQILSAYADASLFIIRHNYTLKSQVQIIDQLYRQEKFPNLGVILNDIRRGDAYRYQYGYAYGYGYYSDEPRSWRKRRQKA